MKGFFNRKLRDPRSGDYRSRIIQAAAGNNESPSDDRGGWCENFFRQRADDLPRIRLGIIFQNVVNDIAWRL